MADDYTEWLPLAREEALSKSLSMNFIKQERHRDWFMNLAWAMKERGDKDQGRWLAKAFLFLRDFLPQGLVGDHAHISGNDVMEHLISNKETATSRHKVTRAAHDDFKELEEWMQKGDDWRSALANSKAGASGGQRNASMAPGLCSPAYLLAVLIIAHPDNKFRSWVGQLGISWMLSPSETLDVRDGYWKGLSAQNILTCFRPLGSPPFRTSLLADYDLLLGPRFSEARRDMRPHLPEWAKHLTLEEEPNIDADDLGAYNNQGRALGLHRLLHPRNTDAPSALKAWLVSQLGSKDTTDAVLNTWCAHWAGRLEGATTYHKRVILRSLFLRSLRVLRSLATSRFTHTMEATAEVTTAAYLLLDMEDTGPETRVHISPTTMDKMMKSPAFSQYTTKVAELSGLAGTRGKEIDEIAARQGAYFWDLMRHGSFAKHSNRVVELDTLRIESLIHAAKTSGGEAVGNQLDSCSQRGGLMLTHWQDLQVILPGADLRTILTDQQLQLLHQELDDGLQPTDPSSPQSLGLEDGDSDEDPLLRTLFGALDKAPSESAAASPQTTSTQTSLATHATETTQDGILASAARATSEAEVVPATKPAETVQSTPRPTPTPTPTPVPQAPANTPRSRSGQSPAYQRLSSSGSTGARQDTAQPMHPMLRLFKNNTQTGVKRHADGTPKASRLWEMTRQDLRDELTTVTDGFKAEGTQRDYEVKGQLDALRDEIKAMKSSLQALQEDPRLDLKAALVSMRAQTSADLRAIIDEQVANSIKDILNGVLEIKGSLAKAREPGEEGFLSENCPTPEGWTHDTYKSTLLRATWFYIDFLGSPDEGVSANEGAIMATLARFPGLDLSHIIKTLKHVHLQVYRKPFDIADECDVNNYTDCNYEDL